MIMGHHFSRTMNAVQIGRVTATSVPNGFSVPTTMDAAAMMKSKLGVDFQPRVIFGANPHFAWRAPQAEDKIETMSPRDVVAADFSPGVVVVASVDPVTSIASTPNPRLADLAEAVRTSLRKVFESA
jgi:uncharacterized protein (DUF302 family)